MLNIQKKRRSWALYFAGFLLFIQLFSVLSPAVKVHASTIDPGNGTAAVDSSPYGQDSTAQRADKLTLARAVAQCLNDNGVASSDSPDTIIGGNSRVGEYAAFLAEGPGQSSYDDKADCNQTWKQAHAYLGWDTKDTVCNTFQFTRSGGQSCTQSSGTYIPPQSSGSLNLSSLKGNSWFVSQWNDLVRNKYLGGKTLTDALTSPVQYWIYKGDFTQKCGDDNGGGFTPYPWTGNNQPIDAQHYHITYWYTNAGDIQDSYVATVRPTKSWNVTISGYGLLNNTGGQINCNDLSKKLDNLGPAFKDALAADAAAGKSQTPGGALSSGSSTDRANSCEANNGGLGWLGCALLEMMDGVIGFLDTQIRNLLTVNTTALDQSGGLKKAWGVMRNFAYLIIIPMMMVMVIGTAVGFGPFDAYTVKKALPRMVSAVIFMSISYYLCIFLINVSNDVGKGIFNLITLAAPGGKVNSLTDIFGGGSGYLFSGLAAGGLIAGAAVGAVTWGILGSFALVTIVALLIGYVILVIRQVLIVMLLVLSPLAILVWIFPGNDKLWNVWKTTFTAMLMMFPIIMILIASGRFFAATVDATFGGPTGMFIKLIAYIAPYFFIPATFKYGLGVFGNVAGMINDRSRGLFDRQKKYRQNTRAESMAALKQGFDRTRVGTKFVEGRQRRLARSAAIGSGSIGLGKLGTSRYHNEMENAEFGHLAAAAGESIKNNPSAAANDDANKVAQYAKSRQDFIQKYGEMRAGPGATQAQIDAYRGEATNQLTYTEQAYGTIMGSKQMQHTAATAALASGSSTDSTAERAAWMRNAVSSGIMTDSQAASLVKQSGSLVSSAGFGDLLGAANGTLSDADLLARASDGFNPANSHRMRKAQAQELAKHMLDRADKAATTHGVGSDEFATAVANAAGIHDVMNGMTPDVREEFAKQLNGAAVAGKYIREHEAEMEATSNGAYLDRRKTWSATAAAAGAGGGAGGAAPPPPPPAGGGGAPPSDVRLKRNVSFIAYQSGLKLYSFQYLWSDEWYVGVMAQDLVGTKFESALVVDSSGFYRVNYEELGIQMLTLEQWQEKALDNRKFVNALADKQLK